MNRNIVALNKGIFHKPILKVRVYEKADKFAVGQTGNKSTKFVEAAKGTNLFFAILSSEKTNKDTEETENIRSFLTIPLNVMIDCQKKYGSKWRVKIEPYLKEIGLVSVDAKLLFILSPNDLVYLPTKEGLNDGFNSISKDRIYKIVSFTGSRLYSINYSIAKSIIDKVEYTQLNKVEFTDSKESIKEICVPIKVDRLGNITELNG